MNSRGLRKHLLKDGTEFVITFPKGVFQFVFNFECCDCDAKHEVILKVSPTFRTVTMIWNKLRTGKRRIMLTIPEIGSNYAKFRFNDLPQRQDESSEVFDLPQSVP